MSKKTLFIGALASIIAINSVLADTVVTSRNYVDTQDALKQDKITAGTTGNVVTYNGTQNGQAQFSERAIFNPETGFDENGDVVSGHEGDLVTAGFIVPDVNNIYNQITDLGDQIQQATNLPETTVTYKTCYQEVNGDCILWNLSDKNVYGKCATNNDCSSVDCSGMGEWAWAKCRNGSCRCVVE